MLIRYIVIDSLLSVVFRMAASTRKKRLLQEEQVDETNLVTPAMTSRRCVFVCVCLCVYMIYVTLYSCTVAPSTVKRIPKQLEE